MRLLYTILMVLFVLVAIALGVTVLMQSGRSAGLSGAISGGAEQIFGKRKGLDDFLAKLTMWLAGALALLAVVMGVLE